ncbi:unnamed protein product [Ceutorhynchus assimilis]|uniref:Uncharacterized protein n=1 Tax=Ceutorhynchus assimilis TaxID=467358 RepID=A0A9N9QJR6_9CUCU|nr:unnamed protein product [Ceutorhynchus assimilis]
MRTKNFLITSCVIIIISLVFIIFGQSKPEAIQNIVSSTNEQIQNFKDNLRDAETKTLITNQKLLDSLGFSEENPRLYPKDIWRNTSLPVVVTYVLEGQESQAVGFIANIPRVLPNNTILIYNLGVTDGGLKILQNYCNSSRCQIITLDLYTFPSHILDEKLHAYRPVVIQDALSHTGAILFIECNYRFMHDVTQSMIMDIYENQVLKQGVLTFMLKTKSPVTSLTHKKMFEYFRTDAENFQFLQMVQANVIFLINTPEVHKQIMLPWVQCALTQDCIFPIGAQSVGCRFDKKPSYRYSGCHFYDVSALNVVLGLRFKFTSEEYTFGTQINFFTEVLLEKADEMLRELELNSTTESHLQFVTN